MSAAVTCPGCREPVDAAPFSTDRARQRVITGEGHAWHWRCYHREVTHIMQDDGTSRQLTPEEFAAHQQWADAECRNTEATP